MTDSRASLWRNRLARSAVNRKVGGSSPPRDEHFYIGPPKNSKTDSLFLKSSMTKSLIRPLAMSGVQMSDTIAQQYKKGLAKKTRIRFYRYMYGIAAGIVFVMLTKP